MNGPLCYLISTLPVNVGDTKTLVNMICKHSLLGCYVMLMLNMEAPCFSKMLVIIYQLMQHDIPEDLNLHQLQCENLRPFKHSSDSQELYETEHK